MFPWISSVTRCFQALAAPPCGGSHGGRLEVGAAVDIPNTGLPPWSGNACLPCTHNHLGILVPAIGLAEWGRTSKHLERILCVWRILYKLEEYIPSWESIVHARRVLFVFGGYCPSWRNIFQAGRVSFKLGEHILCLEDIVKAGGIYSKLGEHCSS